MKKSLKVYRALSLILLVAVMVTIFMLSHQNGEASTQTSGFVTSLLSFIFGGNVPEDIVRTFGHFSEFAALGFLFFNCIYAFKNIKKPFVSVLFSWSYAWTDEIHQIFVDGRAFQISDLLVDLGGIICGTLLIYLIIFIYEKRKKKTEA